MTIGKAPALFCCEKLKDEVGDRLRYENGMWILYDGEFFYAAYDIKYCPYCRSELNSCAILD